MPRVGDHEAEIIGHGTDTSQSGLPFVWVRLLIGQDEENARIFLASDKGEEKDATAKRMARQALRLCGFDVDTQPLSDLDDAPRLLVGNRVPVNVSKNGQYTNVNIQRPRGIKKDEMAKLTEGLRAHKSKDEEPVSTGTPKPAPAAPFDPAKDDGIPF